jgi:hypothetical protein
VAVRAWYDGLLFRRPRREPGRAAHLEPAAGRARVEEPLAPYMLAPRPCMDVVNLAALRWPAFALSILPLVLCSAVGSDPPRLARDVPTRVTPPAVRSRRLEVRDSRIRRCRERKAGQLGLVLYNVELLDSVGKGALLLGQYVFVADS